MQKKNKYALPTIKAYEPKIVALGERGGYRLKDGKHRSGPGKPLVSIVTVAWNAEKTIERTIRSVVHQTYDHIEYIIIDGGSTDKTLQIVKSHEDRVAYWISGLDEGISDAFNIGISMASGELVGIINADDWYAEDAVSKVVEAYLSDKEQGVSPRIYHGKLQYWTADQRPYYVFSARDDKLHHYMSVNHPTVFVPRSLYERHGLYLKELKCAMDYEWLSRAKLSGESFCYIGSVLAHMSLDGVSDKKWFQGYCEVFMARARHGASFPWNAALFGKMVVFTMVRKLLEKSGLGAVVGIFRRRFSATKKERYIR